MPVMIEAADAPAAAAGEEDAPATQGGTVECWPPCCYVFGIKGAKGTVECRAGPTHFCWYNTAYLEAFIGAKGDV